jgi:cytosine/adenosine deaminase-related metal-dependent hydrolase
VADYLREGHEVAVGTDSLASTPSMDLMADVAMLALIAGQQGYHDADLPTRLLRAATLGGAKAMGLDGDGYGGLAPDGPADLAVFDVGASGERSAGPSSVSSHASPDERAVAELIVGGAGRCTLTVAGGVVLHDAS